MSDRGMKKWAPFSSLPEQSLYTTKVKNITVNEPIICDDLIYEIEYVLNHYNGELINVIYFDKDIKEIQGRIKKIDTFNNTILIENKTIKLFAKICCNAECGQRFCQAFFPFPLPHQIQVRVAHQKYIFHSGFPFIVSKEHPSLIF